jgi:histidine triad (HIT) family protein
MNMSDCLFCKIIRGEIPCLKVYEDDFSFAFLDIGPVNIGHTLVVPKTHYQDVAAMPEGEAARLFGIVHRVGKAAPTAVGAEGFNIGMNTGAVAGQIVMHAHVHVMPRFPNDGLVHWGKKSYSDEEMKAAADKISSALNA